MPICQRCGAPFPNRIIVDGAPRTINRRRFCLDCSPFGLHNTRKLDIEPEAAHPLPPSAELAYLLGVISGDGCLYQHKRTCELYITCDNDYPDLIEKYVALVKSLLSGKVRLDHPKESDCTVIRLCNSNLPVLLNLPCGAKKADSYPIPEWIFDSVEFVKPFIRGLIETDGGIYIIHRGKACGWHCHFTAYLEPIMLAFLRGTGLLGYEFQRKGHKARLSITPEVKYFVQTLEITKHREYTYW